MNDVVGMRVFGNANGLPYTMQVYFSLSRLGVCVVLLEWSSNVGLMIKSKRKKKT